MIVIFPGVGRTAAALAPWRDLLPGVVEIRDPPVLSPISVEALAACHAMTIPQGSLVVGESLGGLIALALAGHGYRAVALDPPLTTQKQWAVHYSARTVASRLGPDDPFHALAAALLGVMPDGASQERIYYPLLDRLTARVEIVTGDVPLWPYRADGFNRACCIDDVDRFVLAGRPLVKLHEIAGSHALLDTNPGACRDLIVTALEAG